MAGPLSTPPGPQGRPVVVQAGGSEAGLRLGSELADVIFTVAQTRGKAVEFRDEILPGPPPGATPTTSKSRSASSCW